MSIAYYNGIFSDIEDAAIPLSDRSLFFGDAVYDVATGCAEGIYLLSEHTERILENGARLGMPNLPSQDHLEGIILECAHRSGLNEFLVYFQLSRDFASRVHSAEKCKKTNILITVTPFELYNKNEYVKLISREDLRYGYCDIKSVNLLPAVIAASDTERLGADECVFIRNGTVTECAHSNIAIINRGMLITHPADCRILPGITRRHLISHARNRGITVCETEFSRAQLFSADEVIITSTTKGMRRCREIDGVAVGCKAPSIFYLLDSDFKKEFSSFRQSLDKI